MNQTSGSPACCRQPHYIFPPLTPPLSPMPVSSPSPPCSWLMTLSPTPPPVHRPAHAPACHPVSPVLGVLPMLLVKCVLDPTPRVLPVILPAVSCLIHTPLSAASFSQHKTYYLSYLEKGCLDPVSLFSKSFQRVVYASASNLSPPVFSSTQPS